MIKIRQLAGASAATLMIAVSAPAFAQSNTPGTNADNRTYNTETRRDNETNWGWLGLLGLAGLMGLKRKDDDTHRRTNVNTPGRA